MDRCSLARRVTHYSCPCSSFPILNRQEIGPSFRNEYDAQGRIGSTTASTRNPSRVGLVAFVAASGIVVGSLREPKGGRLSSQATLSANQLARAVMEASPSSGAFLRCARALATRAFSRNRQEAAEASRALVSEVVEPLADRFSEEACEIHPAFMAEVVHARGSPISNDLAGLGYPTPQHLVERYGKLRNPEMDARLNNSEVELVVLLSRADLKGDIAVTGPILRGVASAFRGADIELLGPKGNCYLIGPPRRVERRVVSFTKASPLANQLRAWKRARAKVEESILGFQPDQCMVVDPDSWITQHGVLPIAEEP